MFRVFYMLFTTSWPTLSVTTMPLRHMFYNVACSIMSYLVHLTVESQGRRAALFCPLTSPQFSCNCVVFGHGMRFFHVIHVLQAL